MKSKFVFAMALLVIAATHQVVYAAGSITGAGRFEKITGSPAAGYKHLYEWDLFLSPSDNSLTGPFRRLGAPPPPDVPANEGYYRINDLPAGTYSILVNQPDFFASPKVVPNIQITDGQTTTLNVDLDVDYSTYFADGDQWTPWEWTWYQTFQATGISVRGVSWRMAGAGQYRKEDGDRAEISILADNGDPDVRNWNNITTIQHEDDLIGADTDLWVRWNSGEIPLVPGQQYAVKVWVNNGCAIYKRDRDSNSYQGGRAYDQNGNLKDFDLNITVFVDKNDQIVTHTKHFPKLRSLISGHNDSRWGQTFVATGTSLAGVDVFAAGQDVPGQDIFHLTWTIHENGPGGAQIGPTKSTWGAYFAAATDLIGVSYNPGDIPLTAGQTYYVEFTNPVGFTPHTQESWDRYDDGQAYKNGTATGEDCAMTIIEYTHIVYEPVGFAGCWNFDETTGSTAADSSGNEHTGTLENMDNSDWVDGKVAGALEFDGINDYVQITDYKGITGSQPRTCAAWIKTTNPGGDIIAWGKPNSPGQRWLFRIQEQGFLRLEVGGGAPVGSITIADGIFHHVAVVSDGITTGNIKFYVDGRPDPAAVSTRAINTASSADVTIGHFSGSTNYFAGAIDDVAIFDKELTEKQIKQLYTMSAASFLQPCGDVRLSDNFRTQGDIDLDCNVDLVDLCIFGNDWLASGVVPGDIVVDENVNAADLLAMAENYLVSVTPGLMAHLAFDETEGNTAYDSSVNSYDVVVVNTDDGAWVPGRIGNALDFDGTDDLARIVGFKGIGGGQSRTMCAWIKTTDTDGEIVSWGAFAIPGGRWILRTEAAGRARLEVGGGAFVGTAFVCDEQWHHIAVVLEDDGSPNVNELKLYIDGQPDAPTLASDLQIDTIIDEASAPDVRVGVYNDLARFYQGQIDDVRIYDRALSAEQIAALAQ